jgi:hypothetical protein
LAPTWYRSFSLLLLFEINFPAAANSFHSCSKNENYFDILWKCSTALITILIYFYFLLTRSKNLMLRGIGAH